MLALVASRRSFVTAADLSSRRRFYFAWSAKIESVIALGVPFLRYRFLQIASMVITASLKSFFDGLGKTSVHMGVAIVMNIANFILCVALIFGPELPGHSRCVNQRSRRY